MSEIKIKKLRYQRNGCAGEGFYQMLLDCDEYKNIIASFTTANEDHNVVIDRCRVINPNNFNDAFRGDNIGYYIQCKITAILEPNETIYDLIKKFD